MQLICESCLGAAERAIAAGEDLCSAIRDHAIFMNNTRYERIGRTARYLVDKFPDKGSIMTQCFGETIVGQMLKVARQRGKDIRIFCPETRPYFQGARLTATVCHDMGFDVTVITDNMPAYVMEKEKIDLFTSGTRTGPASPLKCGTRTTCSRPWGSGPPATG
jgi:methylthioribose-1-phosphate isomerase